MTTAAPAVSQSPFSSPSPFAVPSPVPSPYPASVGDARRILPLNTDSYKPSHAFQYPPGTRRVFSYIESRGGTYDRTLFFGLQALLREYLTAPVLAEHVALAADVWAAHGEPFDRDAWMRLVTRHGGRLPLRIRAVPEGSVVPVHNVLLTIENTDDEFFWLTSFVETLLLRGIWYPTTVATQSWHLRQLIRAYLRETGDEAGLPFKLHDFGARGVSSFESAMLGGMAHLVNFQGSDTMSGVLGARIYYGEPMAGFSVPAAEHSSITTWGRDGEVDAYRNMLARFGTPGAVFSVVSDSWDIYAAVDRLWGQALRDEVIASGATLVVRPDSGEPASVVPEVARLLERRFGSTLNGKGYKLLNHVRIIQGDGVDPQSIRAILSNLKADGFSADNVVFGMGGALLQRVDRDTQRFALKCSAALVGEHWRDVSKDPVTDPGKRSKRGRLDLVRDASGAYRTVNIPAAAGGVEVSPPCSELRTVYENGELLVEDSFAEIRERAEAASRNVRLGSV